MQLLIFQCFAAFAASQMPDKNTLASIFVNGQGTKAPNFLTQAQINQIDRELTIKFETPDFVMGADMPSPFNDTCNMGNVMCLGTSWTVTPGMDTSTIQTRHRAMTTAAAYDAKVGPTITWTMTAGKKYSMIFADALSDNGFWNQGAFAPATQVFHYAVYNMNSTDVATATSNMKSNYYPPGNVVSATPNIYAFMVFEHDNTVVAPTQAGGAPFNLQAHITAANFSNGLLVAMNYFKVYGNIYSKANLATNPAYTAMTASFCVMLNYTYSATTAWCQKANTTSSASPISTSTSVATSISTSTAANVSSTLEASSAAKVNMLTALFFVLSAACIF